MKVNSFICRIPRGIVKYQGTDRCSEIRRIKPVLKNATNTLFTTRRLSQSGCHSMRMGVRQPVAKCIAVTQSNKAARVRISFGWQEEYLFFISDHSSSYTLHMRVGNETKSHHFVFYTCPCFPIVRYIAVRPLPGEEKIIFLSLIQMFMA